MRETNHRRKLHVELGNSDMHTAETMHAFETFCKSCTGTESNSDARTDAVSALSFASSLPVSARSLLQETVQSLARDFQSAAN